MRDYFKSWRRKMGTATLVMACVLVAGWVRSLSFSDYVSFSCGSIESVNGFVILHRPDETLSESRGSLLILDTLPSGHGFDPDDKPNIKWHFCWLGFRFGAAAVHSMKYLVIPYWSIVIPLILLSAYLLLRKPRSKPNQPVNHA